MSKQAFDRKIEALESLRSAPEVSKALTDRNNYFVSKAAALAADLQLRVLTPDLLAAFDRFLIDPVKSDPQCWAKNALVKALKDLGHRDAQVFLKGIDHVQLEPAWGGRADSAATLRGACALALVDCELDQLEILKYLGDKLADPEKPVRLDAALAIGQLGRPEGAMLLRLKALLGDSEPEVVGQCFASLLSLAPSDSVGFASRFLRLGDEDVRLEAAAALAQSRELEALEVLKRFWRERLPATLRDAVLISLGASPLPEAAEFILSVLAEESGDIARTALSALAASRYRGDFRDRVRAAIEDKPDLKPIFEEKFGAHA